MKQFDSISTNESEALPVIKGLWKQIETAKESPESIYTCVKCGKQAVIHPNYFKYGIKACIGSGGCCTVEEVATNMTKMKGWIFHRVEHLPPKWKIHFTCDVGHVMCIDYESLRKGCNCSKCYYASRSKKQVSKIVRPLCGCEGDRRGSKPRICVHYNFKVMCPNSADEWDHSRNGNILPEHIAPCSSQKYWFKCKTCYMEYDQTPNSRTAQGSGCPYCAGKKVSINNCLATIHPELCSEWSSENEITPYDVTPGSGVSIKWICLKHGGTPFIYEALVQSRTRGTGCPKCGRIWDRKLKKHPIFVKIANIIHSGKYQYIEDYKGNDVPIAIYCPVIDIESNDFHGIFQQTPKAHKIGHGCPKCNIKGLAQLEGGHDEFVRVASAVHDSKYQYIGIYNKALEKVDIYCPIMSKDFSNPEVHGIFKQTPANHKSGQGCPKCKNEKRESKGIIILQKSLNFLGYVNGSTCMAEHSFPDLRYTRLLKIDRFLPMENLVIEYDGQQHFRVTKGWSTPEQFIESQTRDLMKDIYCIKHKINLLRIPYSRKADVNLISVAIQICRTGKHLYVSYAHYYAEISKLFDMSNIAVIIMPI